MGRGEENEEDGNTHDRIEEAKGTYRRRRVCVHELRILWRIQVQDGLNFRAEHRKSNLVFTETITCVQHSVSQFVTQREKIVPEDTKQQHESACTHCLQA